MINVNIPATQDSTAFRAALSEFNVTTCHYNNEVHVRGTPDDITNVLTFLETYDLTTGVIEDKTARFEKAVQAHLDDTAKVSGYDNILSACSYAGHTNPYQTEGQSFLSWRGAVWSYCYIQIGLVMIGSRSEPSVEELIAELPLKV